MSPKRRWNVAWKSSAIVGPLALPAWTLAAATVRSYTPSGNDPPTTPVPLNVSTQVRPSPDGFPGDTVTPVPAPSRPASANAPPSRKTCCANVTVSERTIDRCAEPESIDTPCTDGGGATTLKLSVAP